MAPHGHPEVGFSVSFADYLGRIHQVMSNDAGASVSASDVIDAVPVSADVADELGYGRVRMWIDAEIWIARRAAMWDPDGSPLKSVHTGEIRRVGGFWTRTASRR